MHRLVMLEDDMRTRMDQFMRETADVYASILVDCGAERRSAPTSHEPVGERISGMPELRAKAGQTAIIPVVSAGRADGGVVIRQRTIVTAMMALFAECWEQGQPLTDTGTEPLSPAEMAVIKLLATGAKDDAIARQLGTSVRTIRRIVGNLMKRADGHKNCSRLGNRRTHRNLRPGPDHAGS